MVDRCHRRPVRCRVGRDRGRSDHRDVGRIDSGGPDNERESIRTACRHPLLYAQQRTGPVGSDGGRVPIGAVADQLRRTSEIIAAAEDAADMRRRLGAAALEMDAASDGSGPTRWRATVAARLPSRTGRNEGCSSRRSMPIPVNRSCSTATAAWIWWTPSPPARPSGAPYRIGDNLYIDGGYRRSSENADLAAGYHRVLVLSPLGGRSRAPVEWNMHLGAQVDELRVRGSRVEPSCRTATPATHSAAI